MHAFYPQKIGIFVYGKFGGKEQLLLPESVKYCTLRSSLSTDIPYLVHDANHTACLVYSTHQKGLSYDIENEDEFWEIFLSF